MPPLQKFTKEDILEAAYNIAKKESFSALNARKIAKELGSSVQPIFHNFKNMDELIQEVYKKAYNKYQEYMQVDLNEDKAYKKMGLGYIKFAKDYPNFFKAIFMQNTSLNPEEFILADDKDNNVIKAGQRLTGFSLAVQKKFHVKVWIFTHGIACLVASGTVKLTDKEISDLLEKTVKQLCIGFKEEKNEKYN